jgi:hypothetical protein
MNQDPIDPPPVFDTSFQHLTHRTFRSRNSQGGAEEAKAFVDELLRWKAEGVVGNVEGEK